MLRTTRFNEVVAARGLGAARPTIGRMANDLLARLRRRLGGAPRTSAAEFATIGEGFIAQPPFSVVGGDRIHVGTGVKLGPGSELKANVRFPGSWLRHPEGDHVEQTFEPVIRIGDRVTATASLQVVAFQEVVIEDDVMFAANVFVADGTHATETGDRPYKYQGIGPVAPIRIGRGAWLGQNVVVMPGVTIGELAVVGANSVVTRDVPPRTIVGGVPAKAIKSWDASAGVWVSAE